MASPRMKQDRSRFKGNYGLMDLKDDFLDWRQNNIDNSILTKITNMPVPQSKEEAEKQIMSLVTPEAIEQGMDFINPAAPVMGLMTKGTKLSKLKQGDYDPRYLSRKSDAQRLENMSVTKEDMPHMFESPEVSILDYEGRPFFSGMADRTDAGRIITNINDVPLKEPVRLRGGQEHMKYGDAMWASETRPVTRMYNRAEQLKKEHGEDPLFLPFVMAPSGGDYAHMTGEAMLEYARSNMGKDGIKDLTKALKEVNPEFGGFGLGLMDQYRSTPTKVRAQMRDVMDKKFRDEGGLSLAEARIAVSDPNLLTAPDASLYNVGLMNPELRPTMAGGSGHPSYRSRIEGSFEGRLGDRDKFNLYDLAKPRADELGINPRDLSQKFPSPKLGKPTDPMYWARQGELVGGLLTPEVIQYLRSLGVK